MDFQNVNLLNDRLNKFSGNLLPVTSCGSFPLSWRIYAALAWIVQLIRVIMLIIGCMLVPFEKTLHDGIVCFAVPLEMLFLVMQIQTRNDLVLELIQKVNDILDVADDTMKNIVRATLKPVYNPLYFYWFISVMSILLWICSSFMAISEKNLFHYEDFRIPITFCRQPFSLRIFLLGSLFILISTIFIFIKKVGVDVYMVHLVLMMTAQYRYISVKVAMIFQEGISESTNNHSPEINKKIASKMRALCHHYNRVIHITSLLKRLLSSNISFIYVNSVFRFCFIGVTISSKLMSDSTSYGEGIFVTLYATGAIIQLHILCSCVQHLLDASTELTDQAFHEKWYLLEPSTKRIYMSIIMANNLKCKLATIDKFNLSVPSLMVILNQSYSIAIIFMKMN